MPSFIMGILFFAITGIVLFFFLRGIVEWMRNNAAPLEAVRAQLVHKQEHVSTSMVPIGSDGAMMPMDDNWFELIFRTETGEEKKYQVSQKVYEAIRQGDAGTLECKGTRFMAFQPE